jgi:hypothetical protein
MSYVRALSRFRKKVIASDLQKIVIYSCRYRSVYLRIVTASYVNRFNYSQATKYRSYFCDNAETDLDPTQRVSRQVWPSALKGDSHFSLTILLKTTENVKFGKK